MSTSSNSFDMLRIDCRNEERALMLKIDSERSILLLNDSEEFMFFDNFDKLMKIWELCEKWNELNFNELILHQNSQTKSKSYTWEKIYINSLLSWATCLVFISLICSFYSFIICHVVCYDRLLYFNSLFYSYHVMSLSMLSDDMLIEIIDERLSERVSQSFDDVLIHTFYSYVRPLESWQWVRKILFDCIDHFNYDHWFAIFRTDCIVLSDFDWNDDLLLFHTFYTKADFVKIQNVSSFTNVQSFEDVFILWKSLNHRFFMIDFKSND
jgi:hypothetical protein